MDREKPLKPHGFRGFWSEWRDLNPRPLDPQGPWLKNRIVHKGKDRPIFNALHRATLPPSAALFRCFSGSFWYGFWCDFGKESADGRWKQQKSARNNYNIQFSRRQIIRSFGNSISDETLDEHHAPRRGGIDSIPLHLGLRVFFLHFLQNLTSSPKGFFAWPFYLLVGQTCLDRP